MKPAIKIDIPPQFLADALSRHFTEEAIKLVLEKKSKEMNPDRKQGA